MDITEIVQQYYSGSKVDSAEYIGDNIIKISKGDEIKFYTLKRGKLYLYEPRLVIKGALEHSSKFKAILRECKIDNLISDE